MSLATGSRATAASEAAADGPDVSQEAALEAPAIPDAEPARSAATGVDSRSAGLPVQPADAPNFEPPDGPDIDPGEFDGFGVPEPPDAHGETTVVAPLEDESFREVLRADGNVIPSFSGDPNDGAPQQWQLGESHDLQPIGNGDEDDPDFPITVESNQFYGLCRARYAPGTFVLADFENLCGRVNVSSNGGPATAFDFVTGASTNRTSVVSQSIVDVGSNAFVALQAIRADLGEIGLALGDTPTIEWVTRDGGPTAALGTGLFGFVFTTLLNPLFQETAFVLYGGTSPFGCATLDPGNPCPAGFDLPSEVVYGPATAVTPEPFATWAHASAPFEMGPVRNATETLSVDGGPLQNLGSVYDGPPRLMDLGGFIPTTGAPVTPMYTLTANQNQLNSPWLAWDWTTLFTAVATGVSVSDSPVSPGDAIAVEIAAANFGWSQATATQIVVTIPAGLTLVDPPGNVVGNQLFIDIGDLPGAGLAELTLTAIVGEAAAGSELTFDVETVYANGPGSSAQAAIEVLAGDGGSDGATPSVVPGSDRLVASAVTSSGSKTLPFTGASVASLAAFGLIILALGAAAALGSLSRERAA